MNLLRKVPIFKSVSNYKKYNANLYNLFRCSYSETKAEVKESEEHKSAGKLSPEEKKELKGPFIKNLFAGIFDVSFLEYPEYQSMEIIKEVSGAVNPVEEYILNCVDSDYIDNNKKLPKEVSDYIKEQKLYGLSVPLEYGGLDLDDRCYARFSEAVGSDMSIAASLSACNRATNAIVLFGNEIQKQNNLSKIATGDLSVSFCMLEKPNVFDAFDMDTVALPGNDGEWTISGKKIWVTNGSNADKYIVFVKTWEGSIDPQDDNVLTAFLLDKNTPGITCSEPNDLLGSRAVNVCDVTFDNVKVKDEDILGEVGSGSKIAFECLSRGRLSAAASAVGYLKYVFNALIEYVNNTKISGKPMGSYEHYRKSLGVIATDLYALESMVYLTAGIKDTYSNSDLSIEESIVKVYSMEKMTEIVDKCVEIVGGNAYIKGSLFEKFFRDSRSFVVHDVVPLDVTKLFLSTLGVHHAGKELQSNIKKARNPFDFPGFVLKAMWKERNAMADDIKIPELLKLELHPSLSREADLLEKCSIKFEYVIKNLLRRWGIEIVDKQLDLIRIADCVVKMYAMTAVLGRASRSYCIGFANSDYEVQVANIICNLYSDQVLHILNQVMMGPGDSGDECCCLVGDKIISQKRYFFTHPLERNY